MSPGSHEAAIIKSIRSTSVSRVVRENSVYTWWQNFLENRLRNGSTKFSDIWMYFSSTSLAVPCAKNRMPATTCCRKNLFDKQGVLPLRNEPCGENCSFRAIKDVLRSSGSPIKCWLTVYRSTTNVVVYKAIIPFTNFGREFDNFFYYEAFFYYAQRSILISSKLPVAVSYAPILPSLDSSIHSSSFLMNQMVCATDGDTCLLKHTAVKNRRSWCLWEKNSTVSISSRRSNTVRPHFWSLYTLLR